MLSLSGIHQKWLFMSNKIVWDTMDTQIHPCFTPKPVIFNRQSIKCIISQMVNNDGQYISRGGFLLVPKKVMGM